MFQTSIIYGKEVRNYPVNHRDLHGKTPLHHAAANNDIYLVEKLLSWGAEVHLKDHSGKTPLHDAAIKNKGESHFEVIETLLKTEANVNAPDKDGLTPLWFLVKNGNVHIVQLLISFKANINIVDCRGCNILFLAVDSYKNEEFLQFFIDLGLYVDHRNLDGETPLFRACGKLGNVDLIKCLLKNQANIDTVDSKGHLPLFKAFRTKSSSNRFNGKKLKKNLNFVMEHTNFNVNGCSGILTFVDEPHSNNLWKIVVEHIAKLRTIDIPVHPDLLNTVRDKEKFNHYFNQCRKELLRAKNTKFKNSGISYYNLLVDSRKKFINYAENKNLIDDFIKSKCEKKFPIYGSAIVENVKKSIKSREFFDESFIVLSNCLPIFNSNHLIIRDMLDCILSKKYLSKFCTKE